MRCAPLCRRVNALLTRPRRTANSSEDGRRLAAIICEIPNSPAAVLARSAAEALLLCGAHSAGIDVLEGRTTAAEIRRLTVVGPLAVSMESRVPRRFSPSDTVIEQNAPQLFRRSDRHFPYLAEWQPSVFEILLVPFAIADRAAGAIWVVSHEDTRTFDKEDERRLTNLARCGSACYELAATLADLRDEPSTASRKLASELLSLRTTLEALRPELPIPLCAHERLLSGRQQQVCRLVALGHTHAAIAAALDVNEKTVGTYRARIVDKLGFRTRTDFVRYAIAQGWFPSV